MSATLSSLILPLSTVATIPVPCRYKDGLWPVPVTLHLSCSAPVSAVRHPLPCPCASRHVPRRAPPGPSLHHCISVHRIISLSSVFVLAPRTLALFPRAVFGTVCRPRDPSLRHQHPHCRLRRRSSLLARSSCANLLSLIIALPLFKKCTSVRSARPCYPMGPFSDAKSHSFCGPISAHKKVPFSAKLPDHLVRANLTIWAHRVPGLPRAVVAVQSSPSLLRFPAAIRSHLKNPAFIMFQPRYTVMFAGLAYPSCFFYGLRGRFFYVFFLFSIVSHLFPATMKVQEKVTVPGSETPLI